MGEFAVFRSLAEAEGRFAPSAVSIGNFDGVHRGHQELFRRLSESGRRLSATPSVITFDPHPARVLAPQRAPRLLMTLEERLRAIARCGVEQALVIPFDEGFSRLTAEEFAERVLVRTAGARAVIVGDNFRFGNRAAGDTRMLREFGARWRFETDAVSAVVYRRRIVSSTAIRGLIEGGDVRMANRMLTRPYALAGRVVKGHGIGSKQTVPTLNLETIAEVIPGRGVYVTRTHDVAARRWWRSVTNVGYRPTFAGESLSIETFLLEGLEGPTPESIRVEFLIHLRDERKFEDVASLKSQILRDVGRAKRYHSNVEQASACAMTSVVA